MTDASMLEQAVNLERERASVQHWNAHYPPGTEVVVTKDDGTVVATRTYTPAQLLSGHTAVVWCIGVRGCYALTHVRPIEEAL